MKKVIRLTESDLEKLVKKIIKEEKLTEIGTSDFSNIKEIKCDNNLPEYGLKAGTAILRGVRYVVLYKENTGGKKEIWFYEREYTDSCSEAKKYLNHYKDEFEKEKSQMVESKFRKKIVSEHGENPRYMFFSNLEQIKRQAELLLDLNEDQITQILENGHDWAQDHIATATETMDQVFDFLMNETKTGDMGNQDDYGY